MNQYDSTSREFGWDDEIQRDDTFQVLPEGDYRFTVTRFERARHSGSEKIPACPKAVLTVAVSNAGASGEVQTNLFLHSKFEWKLCQFFVSIGQRKHGEAHGRQTHPESHRHPLYQAGRLSSSSMVRRRVPCVRAQVDRKRRQRAGEQRDHRVLRPGERPPGGVAPAEDLDRSAPGRPHPLE